MTKNLTVRLLSFPIHAYRLVISPWLGPSCRFEPSCSSYALVALEEHGPLRGLWLSLRRVLRCHPFHPAGFDPVPRGAASEAGLARP
ncbi:MAG: membrane protein insertion efficiency factor YidD [Myxococcota bacterium]